MLYLGSHEGGKDASVQRLMQSQQQIGCHRNLGHINRAHCDPLGSVHAKCHWQ